MNEQSLVEAGHEKIVTVDVREDIRNGQEPFSKIMIAVAALATDEQLRLLAPFEPVPLFGVMEKRGFKYAARPIGDGDWDVLFTRGGQPSSTPGSSRREEAQTSAGDESQRRVTSAATEIVDVDARGFEPPQPMVTILKAVAGLPEGKILRARTDRRPMHLYPQLEERGFTAESLEQTDGSFLTHIWRR